MQRRYNLVNYRKLVTASECLTIENEYKSREMGEGCGVRMSRWRC